MNTDTITALWSAAWPAITAIVAGASALDAVLPQPAAGSHWLLPRKILSFIAANVGQASNGAQPPLSTWVLRIAKPYLEALNAANGMQRTGG
ncbi:MAG: hypothetical protein HQL37_09985 [Alphaproteobacteria bacterium]|nr:hypothetical protein [Alphaproteobacteria bacterium]